MSVYLISLVFIVESIVIVSNVIVSNVVVSFMEMVVLNSKVSRKLGH
jgi:hypothetical protein